VRALVWMLIALVGILIYRELDFLITRVFAVLLLFVFAAIIALLLTPLVDRIERLPFFAVHRVFAVLLLYGMFVAVLATGVALVVPALAAQASEFGREAPALLARSQQTIDGVQAQLNQLGIGIHLALPKSLDGIGGSLVGSALGIATRTIGALINILLVVVISIYLLTQGRELLAVLRKLFPGQQDFFDFTMVAAGSTVAAYVRGQVIMAGIMGLYTGVTMALLGVRYAVLLGVIAFVLEFIPLVGAPVAMAIAVVVALFQSPLLALFAAAAGVGGHAIEAYIVGPRITGHVTRLHPLAAMAALLIGADVGGLLGALFAVPLAAIANIYLGAWFRARRGHEAFSLPATPDSAAESLPTLGDEMDHLDEGGELTLPTLPKRKPRTRRPKPAT
jgi:predicted PurR-regulated permease PerM